MRKLYRCAAVLAVTLQILSAAGAAAATDDELSASVNNAKIIANPVKVGKSGATASFSVFKSRSASVKDCKIDAVLIARTIMRRDPSVLIVQGYYYLSDDQGYRGTIEVHAGDVQSYKSGGESATELLKSLTFNETASRPQIGADFASIAAYAPKEGTRIFERSAIKAQFLNLAEQKCDVSKYWYGFLDLENNLLHLSDTEVYNRLVSLSNNLKMMQTNLRDSAQAHEGSRTDLRPGPGLAYGRRFRIAEAINERARNHQNVYSYRADFVSAENYAHLGQKPELEVALDRLENDLSLSHYTGQ
ncbi:MAG TPA: hypothetical protein V6C69_09885 [Trichormus sp.]|jgi:hypothetical protein